MHARTSSTCLGALAVAAIAPACLLVTDLDGLQGGAPPNECGAALDTDVNNCGACGNVCPARAQSVPTCEAGICLNACAPGFGDCDRDATNGCEATFATDGQHCGTCGHDCGGGACELATCQPVAIATGQAGPYGIALGGGMVLWINYQSGDVMSCPVTGCPEGPSLVATGPPNAFFLKADDSEVFWTRNSDNSVAKCPIAGCTNATLLAPVTQAPTMIAIDADSVYFSSNVGEVRRVRKDGTGLQVLIDMQGNLGNLAVDGLNLFWSSLSLGVVRSCVIADCLNTVTTISSGYASTSTVAVTTTHVYWAATDMTGAGALLRATRPNGNPEVVAQGVEQPWSLDLADGALYWANRVPGGTVAKAPEAGGAVTILDTVMGTPATSVVGGLFVYYTDETTGTVWKVAR